jgi:membrane protein YdbS with pleckstrin-like domain
VTEPFQETDAWWGAYSGWNMLPSMVICLGLTALIAWGSWRLVDRGWLQVSVVTVAGALWLAQAFRWCYRVFGYNYRLTTRRLFHSKGLLYQETVVVPLEKVATVSMWRQPHGILADTGNVYLALDDSGRTKLILEGVARPRQVADLIRTLAEQARARQVTALRIGH